MWDIDGFFTSTEFLFQLAGFISAILSAFLGTFISDFFGTT